MPLSGTASPSSGGSQLCSASSSAKLGRIASHADSGEGAPAITVRTASTKARTVGVSRTYSSSTVRKSDIT